ncbi:unnamed protein product [Diplocarpon coronariae]
MHFSRGVHVAVAACAFGATAQFNLEALVNGNSDAVHSQPSQQLESERASSLSRTAHGRPSVTARLPGPEVTHSDSKHHGADENWNEPVGEGMQSSIGDSKQRGGLYWRQNSEPASFATSGAGSGESNWRSKASHIPTISICPSKDHSSSKSNYLGAVYSLIFGISNSLTCQLPTTSTLSVHPSQPSGTEAKQPHPPSVQSFVRGLPDEFRTVPIGIIIIGYPGVSVPRDVLSYLEKLPLSFARVPMEHLLDEISPAQVTSARHREPQNSGSAQGPSRSPTRGFSVPTSLNPLQSSVESILSASDKTIPTSEAQPAMRLSLDGPAGAAIPSPTSPVESIISSILYDTAGSISSSSIAVSSSVAPSIPSLILPKSPSIELGPGPVVFSTSSHNLGNAASLSLPTQGSPLSSSNSAHPVVDPVAQSASLPLPGEVASLGDIVSSRVSEYHSAYKSSESPTPAGPFQSSSIGSVLGASLSLPTAHSTPGAPTIAMPTLVPVSSSVGSVLSQSLHSEVSSVLSEPLHSIDAIKSVQQSLTSDDSAYRTARPSLPAQQSSSTVTSSLVASLLSELISHGALSADTVTSLPTAGSITSSRSEGSSKDPLSTSSITDPSQPLFSGLSTILGASRASSILGQATPSVPTAAPRVSSQPVSTGREPSGTMSDSPNPSILQSMNGEALSSGINLLSTQQSHTSEPTAPPPDISSALWVTKSIEQTAAAGQTSFPTGIPSPVYTSFFGTATPVSEDPLGLESMISSLQQSIRLTQSPESTLSVTTSIPGHVSSASSSAESQVLPIEPFVSSIGNNDHSAPFSTWISSLLYSSRASTPTDASAQPSIESSSIRSPVSVVSSIMASLPPSSVSSAAISSQVSSFIQSLESLTQAPATSTTPSGSSGAGVGSSSQQTSTISQPSVSKETVPGQLQVSILSRSSASYVGLDPERSMPIVQPSIIRSLNSVLSSRVSALSQTTLSQSTLSQPTLSQPTLSEQIITESLESGLPVVTSSQQGGSNLLTSTQNSARSQSATRSSTQSFESIVPTTVVSSINSGSGLPSLSLPSLSLPSVPLIPGQTASMISSRLAPESSLAKSVLSSQTASSQTSSQIASSSQLSLSWPIVPEQSAVRTLLPSPDLLSASSRLSEKSSTGSSSLAQVQSASLSITLPMAKGTASPDLTVPASGTKNTGLPPSNSAGQCRPIGSPKYPYGSRYNPQPPRPGSGKPHEYSPPHHCTGNRNGQQAPHQSHPSEHDGDDQLPENTGRFNFHDGQLFDPIESSGPRGEEQARDINSAIPSQIQRALVDNQIDFYDPGHGPFYYVNTDTDQKGSDGNRTIIEVARSCDCYVSAEDNELHFLSFDQDDTTDPSMFNDETRIPSAIGYTPVPGDTFESIAEHFGTDLATLMASNPTITNPEVLKIGKQINVPAQTYVVQDGDTMYTLAKMYDVPLSTIEDLNKDNADPTNIFAGQVLKVPTRKVSDPFAYSIKLGDTLLSIAQEYGQTISSIITANPHIMNPDVIYPGQVVNIPVYMPIQGQVGFDNRCPTKELENKRPAPLTGAKFAMARPQPRVSTTTIEVGPTNSPIVAEVPASLSKPSEKRGFASFAGRSIPSSSFLTRTFGT